MKRLHLQEPLGEAVQSPTVPCEMFHGLHFGFPDPDLDPVHELACDNVLEGQRQPFQSQWGEGIIHAPRHNGLAGQTGRFGQIRSDAATRTSLRIERQLCGLATEENR